MCLALTAGGSVLVPTKIEEKYEGIAFLPGFGVGAVALGAVLLLLYVGYRRMTARSESLQGLFLPTCLTQSATWYHRLWFMQGGTDRVCAMASPTRGLGFRFAVEW
mmetsp:Transcript_10232/g.37677  ORF Transcript_10232/g.37677 Transcript_10232/m.37677 type:complete len:106 (-) Transcript_10232:1094-1411(-)